MKSSQSFFNENQYYITPSDMMSSFTAKGIFYYMKCLGIDQNVRNVLKL